jgi:hypothetical protein
MDPILHCALLTLLFLLAIYIYPNTDRNDPIVIRARIKNCLISSIVGIAFTCLVRDTSLYQTLSVMGFVHGHLWSIFYSAALTLALFVGPIFCEYREPIVLDWVFYRNYIFVLVVHKGSLGGGANVPLCNARGFGKNGQLLRHRV